MSNRKTRSSRLLACKPSNPHDEVRHKINQAIGPRDKLEEMMADDLAYTNSFALDLGRATSDVVIAALPDALYAILNKYDLGAAGEERVCLVQNWVAEDPLARAMVAGLLKQVGLDEASIRAQAIANCLPILSVIENLRSSAASRRSKAVADIVLWRRFQDLQIGTTAKAGRVQAIKDLSNGAKDDN
jgi:hypothetical protein